MSWQPDGEHPFQTAFVWDGEPINIPESLPGPKKRQAEALFQNIAYMVKTWGENRIGFLTLTVGDFVDDPEHEDGRRFVHVTERKEASRRFNSLLTHWIKRRYRCGVVVVERHKNKGIHFHLVVVTHDDIKSGIDFDACFPARVNGKTVKRPDYRTAPSALRREWELWRERAECYGFGRANLQPMRENAEALGRYVAKYISKSWQERTEDDKGARGVRYFGNWAARDAFEPWEPKRGPRRRPITDKPVEEEKPKQKYRHWQCRNCLQKLEPPPTKRRPVKRPWSGQFGRMTPWSIGWRIMCKEIEVVAKHAGKWLNCDGPADVFLRKSWAKIWGGRRWAYHWLPIMRQTIFMVPTVNHRGERDTIVKHNQEAVKRCAELGVEPVPVWKRPLTDWAPSPVEKGEPLPKDAPWQELGWDREKWRTFKEVADDMERENWRFKKRPSLVKWLE